MLGALVAKELRESVQSVVGFHNSVVRAKATSPLVQGPGQRGKDPTEERILQEAVEVDKAGAAQSARLQVPWLVPACRGSQGPLLRMHHFSTKFDAISLWVAGF